MALRTLSFLISTTFSVACPAQSFGTSNQAALSRSFSLPPLGLHSLGHARHEQWRFSGELTSEYVASSRAGERLIVDGETQTYSVSYERQLIPRMNIGVEAAVIQTGGGFLDRSIENWHDWFGLPNGGRERTPRNEYRYFYERDGEVLLDESRGFTGLSDLEVTAGYSMKSGFSIHGLAKLPTGSSKELGGRAFGAAIWTEYSVVLGSRWPVRTSLSGGLSVNESRGPLEGIQNSVVPLGGAGISVGLSDSAQFVSHLYMHGPLFDDSEIRALNGVGAQLALGLRWCPVWTPKNCYELLFQEDVAIESSPDFSLRFALTRR